MISHEIFKIIVTSIRTRIRCNTGCYYMPVREEGGVIIEECEKCGCVRRERK